MKYKKYIGKLTKAQEKKMKLYAQKWIDIGLRTGETDWKTFDKYMPICYEKAGISYPKNVVRVDSPLVGALAASLAEVILRKRGAVGGAVDGEVGGAVVDAVRGAIGDAVDGEVGDAVRGAVRGAVGGAVVDAVRGAVRGTVGGTVGGAVYGAVVDAVDDAVRGTVGGTVGGAIEAAMSIAKKEGVSIAWHTWLGGQFWVGYWWYFGVAAVNFFFDVCKLKLTKDIMERALAYRKVCESVNYIWPNRNFVMVCARPVHIDRDEQGRLHSLTRQAIEYPDGWGLYMIHGVKVTEKIVKTPHLLTKEDWLNEKNIEVRRIIQDRMPDFAEKIGAKKIHKDSFGTLVEVQLPNDPEKVAMYVHAKDTSTKRMFYFRCDPHLRPIHDDGTFGEPQELTAKNAVAASFGFRGEQYNPVKET